MSKSIYEAGLEHNWFLTDKGWDEIDKALFPEENTGTTGTVLDITLKSSGYRYEVSFNESREVVIKDNGYVREDWGTNSSSRTIYENLVDMYLNDSPDIDKIEVAPALAQLKEKYDEKWADMRKECEIPEGYNPTYISTVYISELPLDFISENYTGYTNGDNFMMLNKEGELITDTENGYLAIQEQEVKNNANILCIDGKTTDLDKAVTEFIKNWDIEMPKVMTDEEYKANIESYQNGILSLTEIVSDGSNDTSEFIYIAEVSDELKETIAKDAGISPDNIDTIAFKMSTYASGSPAYAETYVIPKDKDEMIYVNYVHNDWENGLPKDTYRSLGEALCSASIESRTSDAVINCYDLDEEGIRPNVSNFVETYIILLNKWAENENLETANQALCFLKNNHSDIFRVNSELKIEIDDKKLWKLYKSSEEEVHKKEANKDTINLD